MISGPFQYILPAAYHISKVRVYFRSDDNGVVYRKNIRVSANNQLSYPGNPIQPLAECQRYPLDQILPIINDFACDPPVFGTTVYVDQTHPFHGNTYGFHIGEIDIYALVSVDTVIDVSCITDL